MLDSPQLITGRASYLPSFSKTKSSPLQRETLPSNAKKLIVDERSPAIPTRNISLSEQFDGFIATSIEEGRYGNASEVVREGLRLLQQREAEDKAKIDWLRGAVQEGVDAVERGEYVTLHSSEEISSHLRGLRSAR